MKWFRRDPTPGRRPGIAPEKVPPPAPRPRMIVFVVRRSRYEPPEVVGIYDNELAARAHRDAGSPVENDVDLKVEVWTVETIYRGGRGNLVANSRRLP